MESYQDITARKMEASTEVNMTSRKFLSLVQPKTLIILTM